jgi:hypothetical protein
VLISFLFLFVVVGCTSDFSLLVDERYSTAAALRSSCEKSGVNQPEVIIGDSLVKVGNELKQKGKDKEAFSRLDYAVIFYQLALAKHTLEQIEQHNRELATSLSVARSKLEAYEKILQQYGTPGGEQ